MTVTFSPPTAPAPETGPRYSIQAACDRVGLTPDGLRKWERRHQAVRPSRTPGGHRLYSDADLRRLSLLRRLTMNGWRIGEVAALSTAELEQMVSKTEQSQKAG